MKVRLSKNTIAIKLRSAPDATLRDCYVGKGVAADLNLMAMIVASARAECCNSYSFGSNRVFIRVAYMSFDRSQISRFFSAMIKNLLQCFFATTITTLVGIVVIALFFESLSFYKPEVYRFLTKWANQPPLPLIKKCIFEVDSAMSFSKNPSLMTLQRYILTFEVDTSVGELSYAVAYTDDMRFAIYPEGVYRSPSVEDPSYLFVHKKNIKKSGLKFNIIFDAENGELNSLEYSGVDCPIKAYLFGA